MKIPVIFSVSAIKIFEIKEKCEEIISMCDNFINDNCIETTEEKNSTSEEKQPSSEESKTFSMTIE